MASDFKVPRNGAVYRDKVFTRCRDLIRLHIWSGIQLPRFDSWLNNFTEDRERYFAACLLDALIYRSNPQTEALIRHLFQRTIPNLARRESVGSAALRNCITALHRDHDGDPLLRLIPVVTESDPYSKSGPTIAREIRRRLHFSQNWEIRAEQAADCLNGGVNTLIFIDDFLGTGQQFADFLEETRVAGLLDRTTCIYAPLVAHERGINFLRQEYPQLLVTSVEHLDSTMGVFSEAMPWFDDGENTAGGAREFYYELLLKKGIDLQGPERRGYGALEVAYAFEHAAPDNSIPLFWWHWNEGWHPLFDR